MSVSALLASGPAHGSSAEMRLTVDAREAARGFYRVTVETPVTSSSMTLFYPKWIPGEHSPSGPIENVIGLFTDVDGERVPWKRDEVNMCAFHVSPPRHGKSLTAAFDFVSTRSAGLPGVYGHTSNLAVIDWHSMLLHPETRDASTLTVTPTLILPEGWQCGGVLRVRERVGQELHFEAVDLETLIDSPMLIGAHYKQVAIVSTVEGAPKHFIDIVSESDWALNVSDERVKQYGQLVDETLRVFGTWHYDEYHFLVSATGFFSSMGLEHHRCSDNRVPENFFVDDGTHRDTSEILAHELFHSWNGKALRPRAMLSPDYQKPVDGQLLWMYEGLTSYYGSVLAARAGFLTTEEARVEFARTAASQEHRKGREWRPVADTGAAVQLLFSAGGAWGNWRRSLDFYSEGALVWLRVDTMLRNMTNGKKSLDDFCADFFDVDSRGKVLVQPYDEREIYAALNAIAPHDWAGFFEAQVKQVNTLNPAEALQAGGWKLIYKDTQGKGFSGPDYSCLPFTLGLSVGGDGRVNDVILDMPAHQAGISPGMQLIAIDGRRFSLELLMKAIEASAKTKAPMEVLVENKDFFSTCTVDYSGGKRFPQLERDESAPNRLDEILAPRTYTPKTDDEKS